MLFSFLGKAEGGKELCSGGETLLKGGKSQGAPPLYASLPSDEHDLVHPILVYPTMAL